MSEAENPPPPLNLAGTHINLDNFGSDSTEQALIERRARHLGLNMLFYSDPVQLVRGDGVWLFDAEGKRYLDCYNNVPSVGHTNPRVVEAMAAQAAILNVHTRYLHEAIVDYADRLTQTLPGGLDVCVFVNSGTEANELAMRIARSVSRNNGTVVMENSYHGNSTLINELSMMAQPRGARADHVVAVDPPDRYFGALGPHGDYAALVGPALAELDSRGQGVAAFLCDSIFDSHGGLEAPEHYFRDAYALTRAAGGLCIADEVQPGFARTGPMWGFLHDDVVPDIVTFGKPAGNGFPLAGIITSREIMNEFERRNAYFNTFGGSPVAAAVGGAVLDEIENHDLCNRVAKVGDHLQVLLERLMDKHRSIGDVRGRGLYRGVELVTDRDTKEPATDLARQIPDAMKEAGVLMGITGSRGNVLKIRPPLVFDEANADQLAETLDSVLVKLEPSS